jgi:hypothetical protein
MKKIIASVVLSLIIFLIAFSPNNQLRRPNDFYFEVAGGNVLNHSSINKFGRNSDVDSAAVEDVWDGGGVWNEPTVGQVYTITSTSANDTGAGTGARTMQISGLLSDTGLIASETITLAGTAPVTLTNNYQMVHRMIVLTAGSGGVNAGTIYAVGNTDGTVTAQINAGNNQTLMAIFKVPSEKKGCILNYYASGNKALGATATVNTIIKAKPTGEVWQIKEIVGLVKDGSSNVNRKYDVPSCFDPLTIIKVSMDTNVDDVDGSAGFDMVLRPN